MIGESSHTRRLVNLVRQPAASSIGAGGWLRRLLIMLDTSLILASESCEFILKEAIVP